MIHVRNLNAGYRKLQILFDVSASFDRERINVIVGPNGSGKSTLLKSIFGLTTIYSGSITLDGVELVGKLLTRSRGSAWPIFPRLRTYSRI